MVYGVDENGDIVMSENQEILPEEQQGLFPEELPPQIGDSESFEDSADLDVPVNTGTGNSVSINLPDGTIVDNTTGDINIVAPEYDYQALGQALADSIDYNDLVELLSNVPTYTVFPNTSAVNVLQKVLNGVDGHFGYVVLSGSDTYQTHLYYSDEYVVSGKQITLQSPVTHCYYYQYRPSSSSSWVYTYTVSNEGDMSFNLSNQLVYTNLLEGYPDLIDYKERNSYDFKFIVTLGIIFIVVLMFSSRFRARKDS